MAQMVQVANLSDLAGGRVATENLQLPPTRRALPRLTHRAARRGTLIPTTHAMQGRPVRLPFCMGSGRAKRTTKVNIDVCKRIQHANSILFIDRDEALVPDRPFNKLVLHHRLLLVLELAPQSVRDVAS